METKEIFNQLNLHGKVTIVTGASKGLGRVMALALSQAGGDIVLAARNQEEIDRIAKEIKSAGRKALAMKVDITASEDIRKMVEKVKSDFGRIDVLVNNAAQNASYVRHKFEDIPEDEWVSMIQTNITGLFLVSQIVGRAMLAQGKGKIINIASALGMRADPTQICYGVTKAAVIQMTKALALEWAPRGITVNAIAPGPLDSSPNSTNEEYLKLNEARKKRVPLGRLARLEEIATLSVYLASDASDYMTGGTMLIDGGMVLV